MNLAVFTAAVERHHAKILIDFNLLLDNSNILIFYSSDREESPADQSQVWTLPVGHQQS